MCTEHAADYKKICCVYACVGVECCEEEKKEKKNQAIKYSNIDPMA